MAKKKLDYCARCGKEIEVEDNTQKNYCSDKHLREERVEAVSLSDLVNHLISNRR